LVHCCFLSWCRRCSSRPVLLRSASISFWLAKPRLRIRGLSHGFGSLVIREQGLLSVDESIHELEEKGH
ncbi:MAG: hypothetical protein AB8A35_05460, partial [Prochlorococcus sp.]